MTKRTDLHDVLDGLIVPSEKVAADLDLSSLSLFELEALMESKTAVSDEWIKKTIQSAKATPERARMSQLKHIFANEGMGPKRRAAVFALAEKGIEDTKSTDALRDRLGAHDLVRRAMAGMPHLKKTAGNGDPLREHMHRKGLLKKKQAEDVEYTGQVNNGIPSNPEWPRAALGVDAAGRKASPEEKREQEKVVTPDVQHVQPHSDGEQFVSKGAHDEKLLSLFEKSAKKTPEERQARYEAKLDKYITKKEITPERAKEILSTPPSRFKAIYGFGAQERQRDAASRVLQKSASLAAVGAALGRPF